MEHKYDDIINLPRHVSEKRPHMRRTDRAAQFAPFAALSGYDEAISKATGRYVCSICGCVYDNSAVDPKHGIPAGTSFEELPDDRYCPRCRQSKEKFNRA